MLPHTLATATIAIFLMTSIPPRLSAQWTLLDSLPHVWSSLDVSETPELPTSFWSCESMTLLDGTLFVGGHGIVAYDIARHRWTTRSRGLPSRCTVRKLYAHRTVRYAMVNDNSIFRSTDEGRSWLPIASLYDFDQYSGRIAIICLTVTDSSIFIGTSAGLYRRQQGDSRWERADHDPLRSAYIIGAASIGDSIMVSIEFKGRTSGIYRSTDRGKTWRTANHGLPIGLISSSIPDSIEYDGSVGLASPISILFCNGMALVGNFVGPKPTIVLEDSVDSRPYSPLLQSTDFGTTWNGSATMFQESISKCLMCTSSTIWFSDIYGRIYRSHDLGQSWTSLPNSTEMLFTQSLVHTDNELIALSWNGSLWKYPLHGNERH